MKSGVKVVTSRVKVTTFDLDLWVQGQGHNLGIWGQGHVSIKIISKSVAKNHLKTLCFLLRLAEDPHPADTTKKCQVGVYYTLKATAIIFYG